MWSPKLKKNPLSCFKFRREKKGKTSYRCNQKVWGQVNLLKTQFHSVLQLSLPTKQITRAQCEAGALPVSTVPLSFGLHLSLKNKFHWEPPICAPIHSSVINVDSCSCGQKNSSLFNWCTIKSTGLTTASAGADTAREMPGLRVQVSAQTLGRNLAASSKRKHTSCDPTFSLPGSLPTGSERLYPPTTRTWT